jgi:hypothetical protein
MNLYTAIFTKYVVILPKEPKPELKQNILNISTIYGHSSLGSAEIFKWIHVLELYFNLLILVRRSTELLIDTNLFVFFHIFTAKRNNLAY